MATTRALATLCQDVYRSDDKIVKGDTIHIDGTWEVLTIYDDENYKGEGCFGVVYGKVSGGGYDELVVAFRGTNSATDWDDDLYLFLQSLPDQYKDALEFYNLVKQGASTSEEPNGVVSEKFIRYLVAKAADEPSSNYYAANQFLDAVANSILMSVNWEYAANRLDELYGTQKAGECLDSLQAMLQPEYETPGEYQEKIIEAFSTIDAFIPEAEKDEFYDDVLEHLELHPTALGLIGEQFVGWLMSLGDQIGGETGEQFKVLLSQTALAEAYLKGLEGGDEYDNLVASINSIGDKSSIFDQFISDIERISSGEKEIVDEQGVNIEISKALLQGVVQIQQGSTQSEDIARLLEAFDNELEGDCSTRAGILDTFFADAADAGQILYQESIGALLRRAGDLKLRLQDGSEALSLAIQNPGAVFQHFIEDMTGKLTDSAVDFKSEMELLHYDLIDIGERFAAEGQGAYEKIVASYNVMRKILGLLSIDSLSSILGRVIEFPSACDLHESQVFSSIAIKLLYDHYHEIGDQDAKDAIVELWATDAVRGYVDRGIIPGLPVVEGQTVEWTALNENLDSWEANRAILAFVDQELLGTVAWQVVQNYGTVREFSVEFTSDFLQEWKVELASHSDKVTIIREFYTNEEGSGISDIYDYLQGAPELTQKYIQQMIDRIGETQTYCEGFVDSIIAGLKKGAYENDVLGHILDAYDKVEGDLEWFKEIWQKGIYGSLVSFGDELLEKYVTAHFEQVGGGLERLYSAVTGFIDLISSSGIGGIVDATKSVFMESLLGKLGAFSLQSAWAIAESIFTANIMDIPSLLKDQWSDFVSAIRDGVKKIQGVYDGGDPFAPLGEAMEAVVEYAMETAAGAVRTVDDALNGLITLIFGENDFSHITDDLSGVGSVPITITGHGLGGALAELVAAKVGVEAETFNAMGAINSLDDVPLSETADYDNIINWVIEGDKVGNQYDHVGIDVVIPSGTGGSETHDIDVFVDMFHTHIYSIKTADQFFTEDWLETEIALDTEVSFIDSSTGLETEAFTVNTSREIILHTIYSTQTPQEFFTSSAVQNLFSAQCGGETLEWDRTVVVFRDAEGKNTEYELQKATDSNGLDADTVVVKRYGEDLPGLDATPFDLMDNLEHGFDFGGDTKEVAFEYYDGQVDPSATYELQLIKSFETPHNFLPDFYPTLDNEYSRVLFYNNDPEPALECAYDIAVQSEASVKLYDTTNSPTVSNAEVFSVSVKNGAADEIGTIEAIISGQDPIHGDMCDKKMVNNFSVTTTQDVNSNFLWTETPMELWDLIPYRERTAWDSACMDQNAGGASKYWDMLRTVTFTDAASEPQARYYVSRNYPLGCWWIPYGEYMALSLLTDGTDDLIENCGSDDARCLDIIIPIDADGSVNTEEVWINIPLSFPHDNYEKWSGSIEDIKANLPVGNTDASTTFKIAIRYLPSQELFELHEVVGTTDTIYLGWMNYYAEQEYATKLSDIPLFLTYKDRFGLEQSQADPLVIDLDGDGLEITSMVNGARFDFDGNLVPEQMGWVAPDDGFVVLDRDGDGRIEGGSELIGTQTVLKDGSQAGSAFDVLDDLDTNRDRKLDVRDAFFSQLRIWQDRNSDGVSSPDELMTLEEAGIESLAVAHTDVNEPDGLGNTILATGSFNKSDGTQGTIASFLFDRDIDIEVAREYIDVPHYLAHLPNVRGANDVFDLQQAMIRDETGRIRDLLEAFIAETVQGERETIVDELMLIWSGSTDVVLGSRGPNIDARILDCVEKFYGKAYLELWGEEPSLETAIIIEQTYQHLWEKTYALLMSQSHFETLFDRIRTYRTDPVTGQIKADLGSVISELNRRITSDPVQGKQDLAEFTRCLRALKAEGMLVDYEAFRTAFAKQSEELAQVIDSAGRVHASGTEGDDTVVGTHVNDVLHGLAGSDTLWGDSGDDTLIGGAGDDALFGGEGDDRYYGGSGNDTLQDGAGNDTYWFGRGSGLDTILDDDTTPDNIDRIEIAGDITPADITVTRDGNDLLLSINDTVDRVRVVDWFYDNRYKVEEVCFQDGTVWDVERLNALLHTDPTEGPDALFGSDNADNINGLGGDDYLFGGRGGDTLSGGLGNDEIHGDWGDDALFGDQGDDLLYGGENNDHLAGGAGADVLDGHYGSDTLEGGEGDDILYGGDEADILDGGPGNDMLYGDYNSKWWSDVQIGNDVYRFGRGSGQDTIVDTAGHGDRIEFAPDVAGGQVVVSRDIWNLYLTINDTGDRITVENWFYQDKYKVEVVVFADGTTWGIEDLSDMSRVYPSTGNDQLGGSTADDAIDGLAGNDTIHGFAGNDALFGNDGNDVLSGGEGADELLGGAGDDILMADAGDDILDGGAGGDLLRGGEGSDTYCFGWGEGHNRIEDKDFSGEPGAIDTLEMKAGVMPEDVIVTRGAKHLVFMLRGGTDSVTIKDYFDDTLGPQNRIERVTFADGTIWDQAAIEAMLVQTVATEGDEEVSGTPTDDVLDGLGGNDEIRGFQGNDVLIGGGGSDYLYGDEGNDMLSGGADDDRLYGGAGADTLDGGAGDDRLQGEAGDDTYHFGPGSGNDEIYDWDRTGGNIDTLVIEGGLTPDMVTLKRQGDNLLLDLNGTGERVSMLCWFGSPYYEIEQIAFSDGTVLDVAAIENSLEVAAATEAADKLYGTIQSDTISGLGGNDEIYAYDGDDTLLGDAGNDRIYGGEGADMFVGGEGNDYLHGGFGADTYLFAKGQGQDSIQDHGAADEVDTIVFFDDTIADDVIASRDRSNLFLTISETGDRITLERWFTDDQYKVECVEFSDGTIWDSATLFDLTLPRGTEASDKIYGSAGSDSISGLGGDDKIYAHEGDDTIFGGTGWDSLYGEGGSDTIDGGSGNDFLEGGTGNDTYLFGRGYANDTVCENDRTHGNTDTIRFTEGTQPNDVAVSRDDKNLYLTIVETGEVLTLKSWFLGEWLRIELVEFSDGTVWDEATLMGLLPIQATEGADWLYGTDGADIIDGLGGNDHLYGRDGNDQIIGGAGADTVYGESGDDVLDGGIGNDYLEGGAGSDTYLLGDRFGRDRVHEVEGIPGEIDTIRLVNATAADVKVSRYERDLHITVLETGDQVKIESHFAGEKYGIERVEFAGGTVWNVEDIVYLVSIPTDGDDYLVGTENNDIIDALRGDDEVFGEGGNDTLYGGPGSDALDGGSGDDLLYGGEGRDGLGGGPGDDVLDGGPGFDCYDGGGGADTFVITRGDEGDLAVMGGFDQYDRVRMGDDILPENVLVTRNPLHLSIRLKDTTGGLAFWAFFGGDFLGEKLHMDCVEFADGTIWDQEKVLAVSRIPTPGDDYIVGTRGDDTLFGGDGDDEIVGSYGNDTLDGGHGGDALSGGEGDDVYRFGRGFGKDVVYEEKDGIDTVVMADDVLPEDVAVTRDEGSLYLTIFDSGDQLKIYSWFKSEQSRIEQVVFSNGTVWDGPALENMITYFATEGDDWIGGTPGDDTIDALGGNDTVWGFGGNDRLYGSNGNDSLFGGDDADVLFGGDGYDRLYGGDGDDYLDGGPGNDSLIGDLSGPFDPQAGSDTYFFARGYGQDFIYEIDGSSTSVDTVLLGEGITPDDVTVIQDTSRFYLMINDTNDQLSGLEYVEQVKFDDNTVWDANDLLDLATTNPDTYTDPTDDANLLYGTDGNDTIDGLEGDDVIHGGAGNDTLFGNDGNDKLKGGTGDDWLEGGSGDDFLQGDEYSSGGADILIGGEGCDELRGGYGDDILDGGPGDDIVSGDGGRYSTEKAAYNPGNDTYLFGRGSGNDVICDNDATSGNLDTIRMSVDVMPDDVAVTRDLKHLYLTIVDSNDQARLDQWFVGSSYRIERVEFADGTVWTDSDLMRLLPSEPSEGQDILYYGYEDDVVNGLGGDDYLYGRAGNDTIDGGSGTDRLYGGHGADHLLGKEGEDFLYGGAGDDVLQGGPGTDSLYGGDDSYTGQGNDTYIFGRGSGLDTICDVDTTEGNTDTIHFTEGILPSDVGVTPDAGGVSFSIAGTEDQLIVSGWFVGPEYHVERVEFSDGTVWDVAMIYAMAATGDETDNVLSGADDADSIYGLGGRDTIYGLGGDDILDGGPGNDWLEGQDGHDVLYGGGDNDYLIGGAGDDILDGGPGNDTLFGDVWYRTQPGGNDTYVFGRGYGKDKVKDDDVYSGSIAAENTDIVRMKDDILPQDVHVSRSIEHLYLTIGDADDQLTLENWFVEDRYKIERVEFADGTVWDIAMLAQKAAVPTDGSDIIVGSTNNESLYGLGGNDTLYGYAGDDLLDGGPGDDVLKGAGGSDTYLLEVGSGRDIVYDRDSTLAGTDIDAVRVAEGLAPSDISVTRDIENLYLTITATNDQVAVSDWFVDKVYQIDQVVFADGTVWDEEALWQMVLPQGTEQADVLYGTLYRDVVDALGGDDFVWLFSGDDTVSGGAGNDELYGNEGDDIITGGMGDDLIHGGSGEDDIRGNEGADEIYGEGGRDYIEGGPGKNTIEGGDGNDTLICGDDGDNVDGGPGDDVLQGGAGHDALLGGDGNDTLFGGGDNDAIDGGPGDDILYGGMGDDKLSGGRGNDVYHIVLGEGNDAIREYDPDGIDSDVVVMGEGILAGDISIRRDLSSLYLTVNTSGEVLTFWDWFSEEIYRVERIEFADGTIWDPGYIQGIVDSITEGSDFVIATDQAETMDMLGGSDTLYAGEGDDVVHGNIGHDTLYGEAGDDVLYGDDGNDKLYGGEGHDTLTGGTGDDILDGGEGNDLLAGGEGNDKLYARSGENILDGGPGDDRLYGGDGKDVFLFGTGKDCVWLGDGDVIRMGAGVAPDDLRFYRGGNYSLGITIRDTGDAIEIADWHRGPDYQHGSIEFADGTIWDVAKLEEMSRYLVGTDGADRIYGFDGDDTLLGLGGDDSLNGFNGNDILDGGSGNDELYGDTGSDVYIFGRGYGRDTVREGRLYYYGRVPMEGELNTVRMATDVLPSDVVVTRDWGSLYFSITDTDDRLKIEGWFESDSYKIHRVEFADDPSTVWDVDTLRGMVAQQATEGDDVLYGTTLDDTLDGLAGDDTISGSSGNDTLNGNVGRDYLWSGPGDDTLVGGEGVDYLVGGSGDDVLNGGPGDDHLSGGGEWGSWGDREGGSDTYMFGRGFGNDRVYDYDRDDTDRDRVLMEADILPDDIAMRRSLETLFLTIQGDGGSLTLTNWFVRDMFRIEEIVFADGTVWDESYIMERLSQLTEGNDFHIATDGDDILDGFGGDDTILAGAGNDILHGGEGNDVLHGEGGEDELYGDAGADTLRGGDDSDILYGGIGDDGVFGLGGDDTLYGESGADRLYGDAGNDILYGGDDNDWLEGGSGEDILQGGAGKDNLGGGTENDLLFGGDGDDGLGGDAGNDTLDGGPGNDSVGGGPGDDIYLFGPASGQDTLSDSEGMNTVRMGEGVAPQDVDLFRDQFHVYLSILGSDAQLKLVDWFADQAVIVEFADGTIWSQNVLLARINTGTDGDDILHMVEGCSTMDAGAGNDVIYGSDRDETLVGGEGNDILYGYGGVDLLDGGEGNDTLTCTGEENNFLYGGPGNDTLSGSSGDDLLDGGTGDDVLAGARGNDTYIFQSGYGHETISNYPASSDDIDTLQLEADIVPNEISVTRDYWDLILLFKDSSDRIDFSDWFSSSPCKIDRVAFSDGTVWDQAMLDAWLFEINGTPGNDYLNGFPTAEILMGFEGNDRLYGHLGNDTLDGGPGNDELRGGSGHDVYMFGKGAGQDWIREDSSYVRASEEVNTIRMGEGVIPDEVTVTRDMVNLYLTLVDTGDCITVEQWFAIDEYKIHRVEFADGSVWDVDTIRAMVVQEASDSDDVLYGTTLDDTWDGLAGDDKIYGSSGNDVLQGNIGNDYLWGQSGNDTLSGDVGDDRLFGEPGNDILSGGEGNDWLVGGAGVDVLDGGPGNDHLSGGAEWAPIGDRDHGSDTYKFGRGYGRDKIYDSDYTASDMDRVVMAADVLPEDIVVTRDLHHIYLTIQDTSDQLVLCDWFSNAVFRIEEVVFADGTVWDPVFLVGLLPALTEEADFYVATDSDEVIDSLGGDDTIYAGMGNDIVHGGEGNDTLYGEDGRDELYGDAGADTLSGGADDDILYGGIGDDRLEGNSGNDTVYGGLGRDSLWGYDGADLLAGEADNDSLHGGAGDDVLLGGEGDDGVHGDSGNDILDGGPGNDCLTGDQDDDTYLFGRGSGQDRLTDREGMNTVKMAEDVTPQDARATRDSYYLYVTILDSGDQLKFENWFQYRTVIVSFADGTIWDEAELIRLVSTGTDGDDALYVMEGYEILDGGPGNDTLRGAESNDTLDGGEGADSLSGLGGDDLLDGGPGNDSLSGGTGNDTYVFAKGYGHETIYNYNYPNNVDDIDTVQFAADIVPNEVVVTRDTYDLILLFEHSEDRINFDSWFSGDSYKIDQIAFSDGTQWDQAMLDQWRFEVRGTEGNENLWGYATGELLLGLEGNDELNARGGDDILDGGSGEDRLRGDIGNDVYVFGRGYGRDTVSEVSTYTRIESSDENTVQMLEGVLPSDVVVTRDWGSLYFSITDTDDRLKIEGWFESDFYKIHRVEFADDPSTVWDVDTLRDMVAQQATEGDDVLYGTTLDDTWDGLAGDDLISGSSGNDTLEGNTGRDLLYGQDGNDILSGGEGNDSLYGQKGDDILDGGPGSDILNGGYDRFETGNDTYIFGRGYGADRVEDKDWGTPGLYTDTVVMKDGVAPEDVKTSRDFYSLYLTIVDTGDCLNLYDWFSNPIEQVVFADGTVWDVQILHDKVFIPTDDGDFLVGSMDADVFDALGGDDVAYGKGGDDYLAGGAGSDRLYGEAGNDTLDGGPENDYLYGSDGDDLLIGGEGDDRLEGSVGNDVLDGGYGDDRLLGEAGDDTYVLSIGSGHDTVYDKIDQNTIAPSEELSPVDVGVFRDRYHLYVNILATGDEIKLENWFQYPVVEVAFSDGTTWEPTMLQSLAVYRVSGGTGSDTLYGQEGKDLLEGIGGNDTLYGRAGDDILDGGTGNDALHGEQGDDALAAGEGNDLLDGGEGNDALDGGEGNDTLSGGEGRDYLVGGSGEDLLDGGPGNDGLYGEGGNDCYLFGRGFGQDWILDYDETVGNMDIVQFAADILPADVAVNRDFCNLYLTITDTGDRLTVLNYFSHDAYEIERIEFADGTVWDEGTIEAYTTMEYEAEVEVTMQLPAGWSMISLPVQPEVATVATLFPEAVVVYKYQKGTGYVRVRKGENLEVGMGYWMLLRNPQSYDIKGTEITEYALPVEDGWSMIGGCSDAAQRMVTSGEIDVIYEYTPGLGYARVPASAPLAPEKGYWILLSNTTEGEVLWTKVEDLPPLGSPIIGTTGNDILHGDQQDNLMKGFHGHDQLYGGEGDDTLDGGPGNDQLYGEVGNDTYRFERGSGQDTISDHDTTPGNMDIIQFADNITPADIKVSRDLNNLYLTIIDAAGKSTGDQITVENWFLGEEYRVEQISFADGTVWDIKGFEPPGPTEVSDILYGTIGDDVIDGRGGDDVIYGLEGNDILMGGNGNDTLYGGADDDILDGGPGDDMLSGEAGDDTYHFDPGSGQDTINDYDTTAGNTDTIQFTEGIAKEDIAIFQNGSNLQIDYGNGDIVTIQNQSASANAIEQVETNDGYYLTNEDISTIIQDMTAFASDNGIPFSNIDDVRTNEDLMNIVINSWKAG